MTITALRNRLGITFTPMAALEERVAYELECLAYPSGNWVPSMSDRQGRHVHATLVVGGGQSGLGIAFALRREGIADVVVIDRAEAGREGPWATFARMPTLRTPKYLTGPEYGIPSLSFRAWYEARYPEEPWSKLERIPRLVWMEYLIWFRRAAAIEVRNGVTLDSFVGVGDGLIAAELTTPDGPRTLLARKIILANGMDGAGAWDVPAKFTSALPRERWAHTADAPDLSRWRGRRVAILGAGASAFDAAADALDQGATVDLYFRRDALPSFEVREWLEQTGFLAGFASLDDMRKWSVARRLLGVGASPPSHAVVRVADNPDFAMRAGAEWRAVRMDGDRIEIETVRGRFLADFIIMATGARFDLGLRPEFAPIAPLIACWRDRFTPPSPENWEQMAGYPYLEDGFALAERTPGTAPWLRNVHLFNWGSTASMGVSGSSGTGMKYGVRRLVAAIIDDLYRDEADRHIAAMPWPNGLAMAPE